MIVSSPNSFSLKKATEHSPEVRGLAALVPELCSGTDISITECNPATRDKAIEYDPIAGRKRKDNFAKVI